MKLAELGKMSFLVTLILGTLPHAANAFNNEKEDDDWRIFIGAGGAYQPKYDGSRKMKFEPLPALDIEYKNLIFLNFDGFGAHIIENEYFSVDVGLGYDFGRQESDSVELIGLGDIKFAPTAMLSVEFELGPISPFFEIQKTIGASKGVVAEFGAKANFSLSENENDSHGPSVFMGVSAEWADSKYNSAFYGVTAAQALASKFGQYSLGGGIKSINAELGLTFRIYGNWQVMASGEYERFVGDVAKSPIIEKKNQFTAFLAIGYQF